MVHSYSYRTSTVVGTVADITRLTGSLVSSILCQSMSLCCHCHRRGLFLSLTVPLTLNLTLMLA